MKSNMSAADRVIRAVIAVILAVLIFAGIISGVLAVLLGIIVLIFLITAVFGFCPLYKLLHIGTKKEKEQKKQQ